jgi:hypothetical protein
MTVKKEAIRGSLSIMGVANLDAIMPEVEAQMAHAEQLRIQQQQNLAASLAAGGANPVPPGLQKPPVAGAIPNAGMDPNMKHLVAGKGEKAANGPKPA